MSNQSCESCLMPFSQDKGVRENDKFCSLCFNHGKLCYEGTDVKVFQKHCYQAMKDNGMNPILARVFTFMIRFAPRWKNTK